MKNRFNLDIWAMQVCMANAVQGEELRKSFLRLRGCGDKGWFEIVERARELFLEHNKAFIAEHERLKSPQRRAKEYEQLIQDAKYL